MPSNRVTYQVAHRRASIVLHRPEKRNALDDAMVRELTGAFVASGKDPAVKAILLSAEGPAFCAGADLEYLSRVAAFDHEENRADSQALATLFKTIHELRKPVIAVVEGPALAGGCGLASVCDIVLASRETATFGYTEVRIGFIPAIVMIFLIKRVGEGKARELVLRGNIIDAVEAERIGLVSAVVPAAQIRAAADELVETLVTTNSPTAMGLCKEMLSKLHGMNLPEALDFAANMNAAARMTPECKQGVAAFLEKKQITW